MKQKSSKLPIIILILILLAVIAVLVLILIKPRENIICKEVEKESFVVDTRLFDQSKGNSTFSGLKIEFAGIENSNINSESVIYLSNPESNKNIYMKYIVVDNDTGEELFTTDLIPPGLSVPWQPGESMEVGTHNISMLQFPYWQQKDGTYTALTTGENVVKITKFK